MCDLESIILSGIISIVTVIITQFIIARKEKRQYKKTTMAQLRKEYIDPLRFAVSENYFRLHELIEAQNSLQSICEIHGEDELPNQPDEWYAGKGCYLISSCYLTAHLFYCMEHVRSAVPFMELSSSDDTDLLAQINMATVAFSQLGIYYVLQRDIWREFQGGSGGVLMRYREFCTALQNRENLVWYAPLVRFYLALHQEIQSNPDKVDKLMESLRNLSAYLDRIAKGGDSIERKLHVEWEAHNRR